MANFKSNFITGVQPTPRPSASEDITVRCRVQVPATLAINDVLEFLELPEGCVPVGFVLDSTDIDSAAAIVMSAGILNVGRTAISSDAADGAAAWLTGSTIGQTGTPVATPTVPAMFRVTPTQTKRCVGALITTGAGTPVAGVVTGTLTYRPSRYGN